MAKTILIPTDFTVKSLNLAKMALQKSLDPQEKIKIILIHGLMASTSITELLFYSKSRVLADLETPEFQASCNLLLSKFDGKIERMTIDIFSGFTQAAFENYLEANRIDEVYLPGNHKLKLASRSSFDLLPFFNKCRLPKIKVDWEDISISSHEDRENAISTLFFTRGQIAH
ncbi:hypothetical protein J0A68_07060 [Algoriphagus sp. H41]|uniref:Universal stress protein n=1 Tax=Algoriphagus oliviformis TaxID=2811231 RepID=A0ABS3C1A2_9BACT|nr:hypothetical protein [Algoriphagus oliviformis]MBN7810707.1 hypothetical protein [Algoriphagus oliviformis]